MFFALAFFIFLATPEVEKFTNRLRSIHSLKANFTETVNYESFNRQSEFKGTIFIKRPGFVRLEVDSPQTQLIIFDGKYWWVYLPYKNKAYKYKGYHPIVGTQAFLPDEKDFHISFEGRTDLGFVYKLVPRDSLFPASKIYVTTDKGYTPFLVTINTKDGTTMGFRLKKIKINLNLNDTLFIFRRKDAKIIEK